MSRTRIVKGKITEVVEKDYNIFSESNIIDNATELVTEKGETSGISYQNPSKPSAGEIRAKCIVQFRPHDKWSGEFGFDWIRMGDNDTGRRGDKYWYRDIIGKYRNNKNQLFQVYDGGIFRKENTQYDNLLKEFNLFNITWKNDLYVVPVLSIMPNKKAKFTIKLEIKEEPKEIIYKINSKYYKLNKYSISHIAVGKKTLYNDLEITSLTDHSSYEYLDVIAISKNDTEEVVGRIKINPNSIRYRKKVNIALIKVKKGGSSEFMNFDINSRKKELTKYLNQALIEPIFETWDIKLNSMSTTEKNSFYRDYYSKGADSNEVMQNLNNIMHRTNAKFINYYKIYFLEESLGGLYGRCYDIGAPEKSVIVLTLGFNDSTVAHESLHAMSLFHTFDNDSKYTFLNFETDNIMDYSDIENRKFPVISTFSWQWKRLFNFLK
ncbi:hypothetical protein [Chryseobacterium sp. RLHN22]|uniref:hypothetical protein n=1 Tax=Chryseobacterium sp. RLHN22 TaxID=3437885 RepID=UPI003D9B78E8